MTSISSISKERRIKLSDAVSRIFHIMHATVVSMHQLELKRKFLDGFVIDEHYLQVKESLHQGDVQ
jgi:hypothetical protein